MKKGAEATKDAGFPAMREDFYEVATKAGIDPRGPRRNSDSATISLTNQLIQFPPQGLTYNPGGLGFTGGGDAAGYAAVSATASRFPFPRSSGVLPEVLMEKARQEAAKGNPGLPAWMLAYKATSPPQEQPAPTGAVPSGAAPAGESATGNIQVVAVDPVVAAISPIHSSSLREFQISPNGRFVVGHSGDEVLVWDREGSLAWKKFPGHESVRELLCFGEKDNRIATSDSNQTIIWHLDTMEIEQVVQKPAEAAVFSADCTRIAIKDYSSVKVWSLKNSQQLAEFKPGVVQAMGLNKDESKLICIDSLHHLNVLDQSGKLVHQWEIPGGGFTNGVIAGEGGLALIAHIGRIDLIDF
ncbi:MAG: hypothetical protein KDA85_02035, partial [Planctomycetaceae bacterium]|nr:hypothetical protein [Planctomycetaceae bacterium]